MDDLEFYVLFNSNSVKSARWRGDNERLSAMEPRLRLKGFSFPKIRWVSRLALNLSCRNSASDRDLRFFHNSSGMSP